VSLPIVETAPPFGTDTDGVVRVGGTRVTLDTVVEAFEEGFTAEEIQQQYPALGLGDVYGAISYYLHHRAEVAAYLDDRRRRAAAVRSEIDRRTDRAEFRRRLLARRKS
jgi:uncharacterized protein (DUF433 family)